MSPDSRIKELSLAHEIGHFLDAFAGSDPATPLRSRPQSRRLMEAITQSDDVRLLRAGASGSDRFTSEGELFARAYAQYIVTRAGSGRMLRQLQEVQRIKTPNQWPASQFGPIADAFDSLFADLGWRA